MGYTTRPWHAQGGWIFGRCSSLAKNQRNLQVRECVMRKHHHYHHSPVVDVGKANVNDRYYQPPTADQLRAVAPLNTGEDFVTEHPNLSPSLISSHDPILAVFANMVTRMLDARRCIVTMTGAGLSYVIAESTRTLSLRYPHTHAPGDQLMLGGGAATASMDGLCEHTISLLPPPPDSDEPFLLEIPDLARHPKYYNAGYVRGWPYGRFYCGAPLRTKNGVSIGTVCVMDDRPRYT